MGCPIFISYSRKDLIKAEQIKKDVEDTAKQNCWFDIDGVESGSQFEDHIISAIDQSSVVLFLLSESSMKSEWTRKEIRYAQSVKKKIVPVSIDDSKPQGWFLLNFGLDSIIFYNNSEQRSRLMYDLSKWTNGNTTEELAVSEVHLKRHIHRKKIIKYIFIGILLLLIILISVGLYKCSPSSTTSFVKSDSTFVELTSLSPQDNAKQNVVKAINYRPIYAFDIVDELGSRIYTIINTSNSATEPDELLTSFPELKMIVIKEVGGVYKKEQEFVLDTLLSGGETDYSNYYEFDAECKMFNTSFSRYLFFHAKGECLGNITSNAEHEFIALDTNNGNAWSLTYEEINDDMFSDNGNISETPNMPQSVKNYLYKQFIDYRDINKPQEGKIDYADPSNYAKKWDIDNSNRYKGGDPSSFGENHKHKLHLTYYDKNFEGQEMTLNELMADSDYIKAVNTDFVFFCYSTSRVIFGYDKQKKKFFPVWIDRFTRYTMRSIKLIDKWLRIEYSDFHSYPDSDDWKEEDDGYGTVIQFNIYTHEYYVEKEHTDQMVLLNFK